MIKETFVKSAKIIYYDSGNSKDVLILLHGHSSSFRNWDPVLPNLESCYRIVAPNLPGCFGSQELEGKDTIEGYAEFINSFVISLHIDRFYLMGESLGGMIALKYASTYKPALRKMCLVSTPLIFPLYVRILATIAKHFLDNSKGFWLIHKIRKSDFLIRLYTRLFISYQKSYDEKYLRNVQKKVNEVSDRVFFKSGLAALSNNLIKNLDSLNVPTLFYYGTKDNLLKISVKYLRTTGNNVQVATADCQHLPYIEDLSGFCDRVEHFFNNPE
jgi:pimeloyl-ACP methyl ester carboxylesterase